MDMSSRLYEPSPPLESEPEISVPAATSDPFYPEAFGDAELDLLDCLRRQVSNPGDRNLLLI